MSQSGNGSPPSREEIDAKMAALESRVDAKFAAVQASLQIGFADMKSQISIVVDRLAETKNEAQKQFSMMRDESKNTKSVITMTVISSALALAGLVVGLCAISGSMITADRANILSSFFAGMTAAQQKQSAPEPFSSLPAPQTGNSLPPTSPGATQKTEGAH